MQITSLLPFANANNTIAPVVTDKIADVHPLARTPTVAPVGNAATPPSAKTESKNDTKDRKPDDGAETKPQTDASSERGKQRGSSVDISV